ncbi:hypothetical protein ACQBAU_17055 [Propionibacteriaceae bacterium Y2011]
MMGLIDEAADVLERFRRFSRQQWLLRLIIAVGGLVACGVLFVTNLSPVFAFLGVVGLLATLLFPRGHAGTVFLVIIVLWAAFGGAESGLLPLVPVALGMLAVHWAGAATAVGPSFAEVDRRVWEGLTFPLVCAVGAIVFAVVLGLVSGAIVLPPSLILVGLILPLLLAAAMVALWPTDRRPTSQEQT